MNDVFRLILSDLSVYRRGTPNGWRGIVHVLLFNAAFKAVVLYRYAHYFRKCGWKLIALMLTHIASVRYSIWISPMAEIGEKFRIAHGFGTVIGGNTHIGAGCLIFQNVTFGIKAPEKSDKNEYPKLSNFVTVYAGAKLFGNISVGKNAVIASNAVVIHDVPENTLAGGIPAHIIRDYSPKNENNHQNTLVGEIPAHVIGTNEWLK